MGLRGTRSESFDQLIADPERRTPIDYGVRYWPVQRFPYVVFYDLTESEVLILGVMHTSQEPEKWLSRRRYNRRTTRCTRASGSVGFEISKRRSCCA